MNRFRELFQSRKNQFFIFFGVAIFGFICLFFDLKPGSPNVTYTTAIAVLMIILWVSEAIPIGATSLLPIILFPLLGIMNGKDVSNAYINYVIFLFIGGFMMALAMEQWDLHKRIALKILSIVGGKFHMLLLGFMLASAFLSMWMSNTATAMMMVPIALSVASQLEENYGKKEVVLPVTGLLLAIAYSCSIGGIATLVGTPPNLSFIRIFEIVFPQGPEISFADWLIFALPISITMFSIVFAILFFFFKPKKGIKNLERNYFVSQYKNLGIITAAQKRVLVLFCVLVVAWIFRGDINVGLFVIPGWSNLFKNPSFINDGTIAIFVAVLLFMIPAKHQNKMLVDWGTAQKIPWQIVLLFGGGFALSKGFVESGLSLFIGEQLKGANGLSTMSLMAVVTSIMTTLTEFTSNTATTEIFLPIVSGISVQFEVNPLLLMIPVALAGSMAFMFPIATPPNAIVYGSGKVNMFTMAKVGFLINIIAIIIIVLFTYYWGTEIFHIDILNVPSWSDKSLLIGK